ncbi:MAG: oxidative damage protection protein [Agitococcus sp.]|jgi:Fe-S cluster biosynthesis and repair protein YggX|nr:oxidative damage protection protein [Moraxellaceae bacterium]MDO8416986.1 oxidative damage protection protein [Agitococcus sp.]MDO9176818.1 oxidative damage protection protein [Agitococcus sp.]TQC94940.1 oxidative damage protection protein [Moraxellaceae bacterium AER2_44_116]
MTRLVMCRKYQQELEGLAFAPFPGVKGQALFDSVSKQAWQEWLKHQTMLINENHLNVMQPETHVFLDEQREKFLSNADYERPKGWTPEKK